MLLLFIIITIINNNVRKATKVKTYFKDKEIKVSFDLIFGGFKQKEIEPLYKAEKKENPALKKLRKKDYKK